MSETLCLIDTDIFSYMLKQIEPAYSRSLDYLQKTGHFSISCLTYYESLRGYTAVGATTKLALLEKQLQITRVIYLDKLILDQAAQVYAKLKTKGQLAGELDLLIGTTALVKGMTLVTNNEPHYQPLVEHFQMTMTNWMKP